MAKKDEDREQSRSPRNILIEPKFQLKFIAWFSLHGIVLGVFYSILFTYFIRTTFASVLEKAAIGMSDKRVIMESMDGLTTKALAITVVYVLLCAVSGLMFSHRTAGPMYRLRKAFQAVEQGEHDVRCALRSHDELSNVAQAFNKMMDTLDLPKPDEKPANDKSA